MKKIGILFGKERSFPEAFIERVNSKNIKDIKAEFVRIDKVMQGEPTEYAVIIDRISQDVPFYRAYLKNAATKIKVPVPKTVILPSRDMPDDTSDASFANLSYPLDWQSIFSYIGFPAYMKPFAGGGWKHVYKLNNVDEFFEKHQQTGQLVMLLQEEIIFEEYYRCYCIGGKYVRIMPYEPRNPHHARYAASFAPSKELHAEMTDIVLRINQYLGYDFNTVELAVKDGVPYAIDFCNPAPDADINSVGQENFNWVVETSANFAIEKAQSLIKGKDNLTWGEYIKRSTARKKLYP